MAHLAIAPASALDVTEVPIKYHSNVIQDVLFSLFLIVQIHSILCIRMEAQLLLTNHSVSKHLQVHAIARLTLNLLREKIFCSSKHSSFPNIFSHSEHNQHQRSVYK